MTNLTQFPFITPLADAFEKLQKVGGTNLIFEFIGTMLLILAFFYGHGLTGYIVLALGCIIILILFFYSLYFGLKEYNKIKRTVRLTQETALELAEVTSDLIKLEKKYSEEVKKYISSAQRIYERSPRLKELENLFPSFDSSGWLTGSVREILFGGEFVIGRFTDALMHYDSVQLQEYLSNLKAFDRSIKMFLYPRP